jgi:hypothetical protein
MPSKMTGAKLRYYEKNREACLLRSHQQRLRNKIGKAVSQYEHLSSTEAGYKRQLVNPRGHLLSRAKANADKKGREFSLTLEDIIIPDVCPYFGIPIKFNKGSAQKDSISIDRIDNSKGYVPGNIEVISHAANCMKRDSTIDEQIRFAKEIIRRYVPKLEQE